MARFEEELSYYRPPGEMINPTQLIPSIPVQPTPNVNNSIIDSSKISISLGECLIKILFKNNDNFILFKMKHKKIGFMNEYLFYTGKCIINLDYK